MRFTPSFFLAALSLSSLAAFVACAPSSDKDTTSGTDEIIGGVDATGAKLNAIGALGTMEGAVFDFFCTATLIGPDLVLTAKHCAASAPPEKRLHMADAPVYFGIGPDSTKPVKTVRAKSVVLSSIDEGGFPKYGSDVAVYVLEEAITDVKPMRFAKGHLAAEDVGKIFTAVGYGIRDRQRSAGLRQAGAVTLRATTGKPMQSMFESKDAFLGYLREKEGDDYIASNTRQLDEFWEFTLLDQYESYLGLGKDDAQPCSGDSGGPLVKKADDGELEVVAVVSASFKGWKYPCSLLGESYATLGPKVQDMIRDVQACKGVPIEGSCEGTVAVRCVSDAEGPQKVTRTDCGLVNQVCRVDATTKKATCTDDDAPPPPPPQDGGPADAGPG